MSQDEFRAPAGWYPDPLGHPQLRWWNSFGWTEQVSAAPEPLAVQEQPRAAQQEQSRYAWKEEEPQVIPVQTNSMQAPTPPRAPVSATLHELEAPRAQAKVDEPAAFDNWQALHVAPSETVVPAAAATAQPALSMPITPAPAAQAPAAPAPVAQAPAASTPAPPPFWDEDDLSVPAPSVRPEDLKFWSGTSPAELRRLAREQAARDNQG